MSGSIIVCDGSGRAICSICKMKIAKGTLNQVTYGYRASAISRIQIFPKGWKHA